MAAILIAMLASAAPRAKADFGAAEVAGQNNEVRTFEAWCGSIGNNCAVSFTQNAIVVNGKDTVEYQRIRNFHYDSVMENCFWKCRYTFNIVYYRSDGSEGVGKIIFAKEEIALRFMRNLKDATGNKPWAGDPRCSNGEVFHEGLCLSPSNAAEIRTREKESINARQAVQEHGRAIGAGLAVQGELQREGLRSAGESIQQGLSNVKVEQNTGVIVVPR